MTNTERFLTKLGEPIIKSLLYLDLYKLTMLQFFINMFPTVMSRYDLKVRSDFNFAPYIDEINAQLDMLCKLTFKIDELNWLKKIRFFKPSFINYLRGFRLDREYVHAYVDENGVFHCYAEGPLAQVTMFEIYVLAILQQIRSNAVLTDSDFDNGIDILNKNIIDINEYVKHRTFKFSDFSCRRAASVEWLDYVISQLTSKISSEYFTGTSCVYYAMKYNITPIGTMAHEAMQLGQALTHPYDSQEFILDGWGREYHGDLGIALSDTFGIKYFIKKVFHKGLAMMFSGVRHDSGDPIDFAERIIAMYNGYGINPLTKTIVFSDGLTFAKAFDLNDRLNGRILTAYGIGTNLGNALGVPALQIVMKMVKANGKPVIKVSDSSGKGMCKDVVYEQFITNHINEVIKDVA